MKSETVATRPFWSGQLMSRTALVLMMVGVLDFVSRRIRWCRGAEGETPARQPQGRLSGQPARCRRYFFKSFNISRAAFAPEPPVNPAPGWVPFPQRYRFAMGVR